MIFKDKFKIETVELYDFMTLFVLNHHLQIGERQILALTHRPNHHSNRLHISNI